MRLIDADELIMRCMNGIDNEFIGIVNEMPTLEQVPYNNTISRKGDMTELKQILQEIKDDCIEHTDCQGCKFYSRYGCALKHIPDEWDIDNIIVRKEFNYVDSAIV